MHCPPPPLVITTKKKKEKKAHYAHNRDTYKHQMLFQKIKLFYVHTTIHITLEAKRTKFSTYHNYNICLVVGLLSARFCHVKLI